MDAPIPEGTLIGHRWRVTGHLGEGGFGRVFEAVDESDISLGRAAVKLLHPNISPQERNAFLGEVKKIAALRHPNLVGYLDSGQQTVNDEIHPFLVTELCVGSLSDHLRNKAEGRLSPGEALGILSDVAAGLDHLHQRSLIHRDIKPGNVLYAEGNWKLADFGLMRDMTATGTYHRSSELMGTPMFMAPELFSTMTATAPSDVYALGVLAHLVGTGLPLHTGTGAALVHQITNSPAQIDPNLFPPLRELILNATQVDPAERPTAREIQAFAAANQADAVEATRSVGMFPPPAAPATGGAATTGGAAAGEAAAPGSGEQLNYAPPTVASGAAASAQTVATGLGPAQTRPMDPMTATAVQAQPPGTSGPVGNYAAQPSPSGGRGVLVPVLGLVAVLSLGAVAVLGYLLTRDDTPTAEGGGATEVVAGDDEQVDESTALADDQPATNIEPGQVDATPSVDAQAVDGAGGGPIDLSSPVRIDGAVAIALDREVYTFDGSAGELVSIEVNSLNGECSSSSRWDLELQIVDPSGNVIGETFDNPDCAEAFGPVSLDADGEYSFVALGGAGTSSRAPTGTYSVTVAKLLLQEEAVTLPVTVDGGLSVAFDRQGFTFDAAAGEAVSIEIEQLNGGCDSAGRWDLKFAVLDPAGEVVGEVIENPSCFDGYGPIFLQADGQHSIVAFGGDGSASRPPTGTYRAVLAKLLLTDTAVDLASPAVIEGEVALARDRLRFSFDAVAGERVSVQVEEMNAECSIGNRWDMDLAIVDGNDNVVGEVEEGVSCGDALGPWELPQDGRYALVVAGADGSSSRPPTGSFRVLLAKLQG